MKKTTICALFFAILCTALSAQSADKVTDMIGAETVNLNDIAYFAATYFDLCEDEVSNTEARNTLEKYVQFPKISAENDIITYDDFAYFCTTVWNIKGGLMLRMTKTPRYAFKELQSMKFIPKSIQPNETIDGVKALTIMTQCINYAEEHATISDIL